MKLYMLKALGLAAIMFALVLGGMQAANDGISRTKGYNDPGFKHPVSLEKDSTGEMKVAIMGGGSTTIRFDDGNRQASKTEEAKSFNLFSSMGKALSAILTGAVKGIMEFVTR